jgi:hypothetical protein
MPVTTHSAHHIADPGLRRAIADYLKRERAYVAMAGQELAEAAPFRKAALTEEAGALRRRRSATAPQGDGGK